MGATLRHERLNHLSPTPLIDSVKKSQSKIIGTPRQWEWLPLTASILALWLLCTIAQLEKYLPAKLAHPAAALGCAGLILLGLAFRRFYTPDRDVPVWSFAALLGILVLSFVAIYPLSQKHVNHRGSDREDALRVELVALEHHHYPYDARTFLGHPPTPLPGAMLLACRFSSSVASPGRIFSGLALLGSPSFASIEEKRRGSCFWSPFC